MHSTTLRCEAKRALARYKLPAHQNNVANGLLQSQATLPWAAASRRDVPRHRLSAAKTRSPAHPQVFPTADQNLSFDPKWWGRTALQKTVSKAAKHLSVGELLPVQTSVDQVLALMLADNAKEASSTAYKMTTEQKRVFDLASQGASLYIGGEAGTGKSFLLTAIAADMQRRGLRVSVTAATGIAAFNIGGNTFHSEFGIPLPTPDDVVDGSVSRRSGSGRSSRSGASCDGGSVDDGDGDDDESGGADDDGSDEGEDETADYCESAESPAFAARATDDGFDSVLQRMVPLRFRNTAKLSAVDVIVIDEVSLLHAGFLESLERTLRRTTGRDARQPFGGVQMILSGDFMQLTPFAASDSVMGTFRQIARRVSDTASRGERKVCKGVLPPPPPTLAAPDGDTDGNVVKCNDIFSTTLLPRMHNKNDSGANKRGSADSYEEVAERRINMKASGKRKAELWYYDKPMFENWCFRKHLLHLQLREPQRQKDAAFTADLNLLRCGELPFRLSRSALLNPFDDSAVRILPTKAAVKNFNDRRMLELEGETRIFRTHLTMTEAKATEEVSCDARRAALQGRATLLVHHRLFSTLPKQSVHGSGRQGHLSTAEMRTTEQSLEKFCRLPKYSVRLQTLPVPLSYSTALCALCLECRARSDTEAELRRAAVKAALEHCAAEQARSVHEDVKSSSPPATHISPKSQRIRVLSPASLFPRPLVRLESIAWSQLLRRLQPAMQQDFRDAIRRDTVLQDKRLKLGCRVMLLRNLSTTYVNGSLGTITRYAPLSECAALLPKCLKAGGTHQLALAPTTVVMGEDAISIKADDNAAVLPVVRMDADGQEVAIPWIAVPVPVIHKDWCYVVRATCIPLTPAYAFTVHKIQGVTLDHPVLFDADSMFPCDHLVYVAASRVRQFAHLRIVNLSPGMISVNVPSLNFTKAIPAVEDAVRTWRAWRRKPKTSDALFLPAYRQRGKTRSVNVAQDNTRRKKKR